MDSFKTMTKVGSRNNAGRETETRILCYPLILCPLYAVRVPLLKSNALFRTVVCYLLSKRAHYRRYTGQALYFGK